MRFCVFVLMLTLWLMGGCRRASPKVLPIQAAGVNPIVGAFGKTLGERWPDLPAGAQQETRAGLYIFEFTPAVPMPGVTRYRAWVLPATMEICRLTGAGAFLDDRAFNEFFQRIEGIFGHLAPLTPAESFKPQDRHYWSVTREGKTLLVVRRNDGHTTIDLFDVFLGSRPLEEILSAKGAQDSEF
jgi:hypothetical protein